MKRAYILIMCIMLVMAAGCGQSKDEHSTAPAQGEPSTQSGSQTESSVSTDAASGDAGGTALSGPQEASDDYSYDISNDRKTFDAGNIDINVGDKLYMTQINDWYMNFSDYSGKSVVIEGYYMIFDDKYTFVGRKGPTCPYCTGGYVNFEFKSDQDLSKLVSESSWIRVTGILRQGTMYPGSGQPGQAFYYIEAMSVEELPEAGIDTISD
ncbi:MAG: hypothetical protein VB112_02520 [Oscillospiraceae bacterium]|nr:hypothetical protein [Oscillospiraceae bacterium]